MKRAQGTDEPLTIGGDPGRGSDCTPQHRPHENPRTIRPRIVPLVLLITLFLMPLESGARPPKKNTHIEHVEQTSRIIDCAEGLPSEGVPCMVDDGQNLYEVLFVSERVKTVKKIGPSWEELPAIIAKTGAAKSETGILRTPALFEKADTAKCEPLYMSGLNPPGWKYCGYHMTFNDHVHWRIELLRIDRLACKNAMQRLRREKGAWADSAPKGAPRVSSRRRHAGFEYIVSISVTTQGCSLYERSPLYEAIEHRLERARASTFRRIMGGGN